MAYPRWSSILPVALLFIIGLGGCNTAKEPGGATPADVMSRSTAAIRAGNIDEIAKCQSVYMEKPEMARALADMHKLNPISRQLVIDGVKKFGATDFVIALGSYGLMCISQGAADPAVVNNLFLTKGKLDITGNKAVYTYKVSAKGDEILPKEPELAEFQKAMWGAASTTELTAELVQLDGRWFVKSPDSKTIAVYSKLYQPFSDYLQQVRRCLDASKDNTAFSTALEKPAAALNQALSAAMKAE